MINFVVSRSANSINYAIYEKTNNNTLKVVKSIVIKGGADVINKKTLITDKGAYTSITDKELELLKQNPLFKKHLENGFVIILNNKNEAEKKIEDGELEKSKSAQLTKEELEEENEVIVDDDTSKTSKRKKR